VAAWSFSVQAAAAWSRTMRPCCPHRTRFAENKNLAIFFLLNFWSTVVTFEFYS
jgi:hypothetical protein